MTRLVRSGGQQVKVIERIYDPLRLYVFSVCYCLALKRSVHDMMGDLVLFHEIFIVLSCESTSERHD